jgi:hypothetical protein
MAGRALADLVKTDGTGGAASAPSAKARSPATEPPNGAGKASRSWNDRVEPRPPPRLEPQVVTACRCRGGWDRWDTGRPGGLRAPVTWVLDNASWHLLALFCRC